MTSDEKRKEPDSDLSEDPTSDDGAGGDWREDLHSSIHVKNRALIVEALYGNPYVQISVIDALTKATSAELKLFLEATSEYEYLTTVGDFQKRVRTREISEELGKIPPQVDKNYGRNEGLQKTNLSPAPKQPKGKKILRTDPVEAVLQRHRETTNCFKNVVLLFNQRQPISVMSRQQLAVRLHILRASRDLVGSLDFLTEELESVPNDSSESLEIFEMYEVAIQHFLQTFSEHITNICDCPRGASTDFDGSASVDLNSQMRHLDNSKMQLPVQSEQQPLAELRSDGPRNTILPPQQLLQLLQQPQQKQSGPNEGQTDASLNDDLLAELMALLSIPNNKLSQ